MSKNEQYHGAHLNKKKIVWSTVCSRKWKRSIFSALSNTCKKPHLIMITVVLDQVQFAYYYCLVKKA